MRTQRSRKQKPEKPAQQPKAAAAVEAIASSEEPFPGKPAVATTAEEPARRKPDTRPAPRAPAAETSAPIESLPGIGPGLVWRLNRLGIATFADLAASDVARVRQGLGRLHRLVPLDSWVSHAVNASADAAFATKRSNPH